MNAHRQGRAKPWSGVSAGQHGAVRSRSCSQGRSWVPDRAVFADLRPYQSRRSIDPYLGRRPTLIPAMAPMKILLLASAFNGLTQRTWLELRRAGHEVSVELSVS